MGVWVQHDPQPLIHIKRPKSKHSNTKKHYYLKVEVATITGHKDTRMLMRYTHLRASLMIIVVQLQVPFASLLAWVIP